MKTTTPGLVNNPLYYSLGLAFLMANKVRYFFNGYKNAKPFSFEDLNRVADYDFKVVENWLYYLKEYTDGCEDIRDKIVFELGPGDDLGVAVILLSKGARKYNAFDVNYLIKNTPQSFYDALFSKIHNELPASDIEELKRQVELVMQQKGDRINYVHGRSFSPEKFKSEKINLVLSNAAFEHISDFEKVIGELSPIVEKDCVLISKVDMKTHSRWIKDLDPNNIYRYSDFIYKLFQYSGIPNRLRPKDYCEALRRHNWKNIEVFPTNVLTGHYFEKTKDHLHKKYKTADNQMEYLTVMICASRE